MDSIIHIYTDGSSKGNPGPGGWASVLMYKGSVKEISGGYRHTTNNRMELTSVIEALKALKKDGNEIIIYSDSKYVVDSIQKKWVYNWQKSGFKDRLNADLWKEYLELSIKNNIQLQWVKGHSSNEYNNRCDVLATTASSNENKNNWLIDTQYEKITS